MCLVSSAIIFLSLYDVKIHLNFEMVLLKNVCRLLERYNCLCKRSAALPNETHPL